MVQPSESFRIRSVAGAIAAPIATWCAICTTCIKGTSETVSYYKQRHRLDRTARAPDRRLVLTAKSSHPGSRWDVSTGGHFDLCPLSTSLMGLAMSRPFSHRRQDNLHRWRAPRACPSLYQCAPHETIWSCSTSSCALHSPPWLIRLSHSILSRSHVH